MKVTFAASGRIDVADADGVRVYAGEPGDTIEVPKDIAELLMANGFVEKSAKSAAEPEPEPEEEPVAETEAEPEPAAEPEPEHKSNEKVK